MSGKFASAGPTRSLFGDVAIVAFLVAQMLDGLFTYVGVQRFGPSVEANPIVASLMATLGDGTALTAIKVVAASFGIGLHLTGVHRVVAALTAVYLAAAVLPWVAIFFL